MGSTKSEWSFWTLVQKFQQINLTSQWFKDGGTWKVQQLCTASFKAMALFPERTFAGTQLNHRVEKKKKWFNSEKLITDSTEAD